MANTPIDSDAIRALAELLDETGLTEIEYDSGALRIRIAKGGAMAGVTYASAPAAIAAAPAAVADPADHPGAIKAPMVGVVYHSSEPGAAAFVQVGDSVAQGQTLVLIEAMKTFNPVRAPRAGTVAAILVDDATPVEFGEPLIILE
ncbi:acetyl-CoA carboxylase biotin carboxyl carrier protein subunit [Rhodospirillum rubrum]|uniref:acetyl-CoA carboxylase biotin carboxyl carrier protein n=1 Tax=Rhodospirillum rubrum TaxID=1085 RepID=UPI00190625C3|nr:acetyl-CoA carboxylase biotin carboxyl carrier protein subunit [Rhodospirillum rubrum]MBK1665259.1 acetyl-CoA carboxylase biotin carboxyl carrier protein subunit [Rhodospirillum rubrum]MBK1677884.1 acetyl-CoA carboxylase biotin carboxyl carrier protein subunit [Rhodospirillum rubrum]